MFGIGHRDSPQPGGQEPRVVGTEVAVGVVAEAADEDDDDEKSPADPAEDSVQGIAEKAQGALRQFPRLHDGDFTSLRGVR